MPHWHLPNELIKAPFTFVFPTQTAAAVAALLETMAELAVAGSPDAEPALAEADIRTSYRFDLEQFPAFPYRD
jgi:hypothetical protein